MALVSADAPVEHMTPAGANDAVRIPASEWRATGNVVSLPAAAPAPVANLERFAFISPDTGIIEIPPGLETDADSWSVEVNEDTIASWNPTVRAAAEKSRVRRSTLKQRLAEISPAASQRIMAKFTSAGVAWPPAELAFVAIKDEKALEIYARPENGAWKFVHRYKVLAASGGIGPKLLRGDKQVPEGVYRISYLNPNSAYHVSMRVEYPNAFDREMAAKDGRKDLGGDIMIHGKSLSAGCLAVGDEAAEELFVLAADVGLGNVKVVIAPTDFRRKEAAEYLGKGPDWVPKLYGEIATAMSDFKAPAQPSLLSLLGF